VLERAFELAQKALALDDTLSVAYGLLSWIYLEKQQYEQALAAVERGIALEPSYANSYAVRGEILRFMGRPEEAVRSVEKAIRLNPRYPAWYLEALARAYIITGRYAEAIPVLNTRLLRDPQSWSYRALANAYHQQWAAQLSQDSQALAAVQRAIVLRDDVSDNYRILGYVYLWQPQYEQALAEMERAIALEPDEARGSAAFNYAGLAEVLSRMGRAAEALGAAEQALRLKPAVVDAHLASVSMAYAVAGQPEQALTPLQRFLSRYPNVLQAHLALAAVYSELGQKGAARA
jgi:tetratricopeptide (TPR) repeat protein